MFAISIYICWYKTYIIKSKSHKTKLSHLEKSHLYHFTILIYWVENTQRINTWNSLFSCCMQSLQAKSPIQSGITSGKRSPNPLPKQNAGFPYNGFWKLGFHLSHAKYHHAGQFFFPQWSIYPTLNLLNFLRNNILFYLLQNSIFWQISENIFR